MKLQRVQLKNIGKFQQLNIEFSTQPTTLATVILGQQSSGKTTILKQIFQALSWFSNRHKDARGSGVILSDTDIKHDSNNASVFIEVSYPAELGNIAADSLAKPRPDHLCRWTVQKSRQTSTGLNISTSELTELETLITRYQKHSTEDQLFSTPCIAYYPVERFIYEVNIQGKNVVSTLTPLHNAYDLTTVNFTTFNKFFEWYREVHDVENAQAAKLFKEYLDPQRRFQHVEDFNDTMSAIEQAYRLASQRSMSSLRASLKTVMPEILDIDLEYLPKMALVVDYQGKLTPFLQLPQATRIWIGLIGDLVRRLCLLNPKSLYPCLEGEGIVLIDAIDLLLDQAHLQEILPRLKRAFPRLQFIVSSQNANALEHHLLEQHHQLQCLQLSDQRIEQLDLSEHQKQLAQIYQDLSSPVSEHSTEVLEDPPVSQPDQLLNLIQHLSKQEQQFILEQLQQHLSLKDS